MNHYGIHNTGARLLTFVKKHFPQKAKLPDDCKFLSIRFNKKEYRLPDN